MQAETLEEAAAKRKAKALPFGGRLDPEKHITDAVLPIFMPRRGTPLAAGLAVQAAPARRLSHFEAGQWLTARGVAMSGATYGQLRAWHPDGVPEDALQALQERLTVRAGLALVANGS